MKYRFKFFIVIISLMCYPFDGRSQLIKESSVSVMQEKNSVLKTEDGRSQIQVSTKKTEESWILKVTTGDNSVLIEKVIPKSDETQISALKKFLSFTEVQLVVTEKYLIWIRRAPDDFDLNGFQNSIGLTVVHRYEKDLNTKKWNSRPGFSFSSAIGRAINTRKKYQVSWDLIRIVGDDIAEERIITRNGGFWYSGFNLDKIGTYVSEKSKGKEILLSNLFYYGEDW